MKKSYDTPLPGIYTYSENKDSDRHLYPVFTAPSSLTATREAPRLSSERAIKTGHIHTAEYCSVLKRKEILTQTTTQMNLEDIVLSETSQSQKEI